MNQEEHKLIENYCSREAQFRREAMKIVKKHAPILSDKQAHEVARIALKSYRDLEEVFEWTEAPEFIERL